MSIADTMNEIERMGFTLFLSGDRLSVKPLTGLSQEQKLFLSDNKPKIIAAIRARELESGQSGNDYPVANDDAQIPVEAWTPSGERMVVLAEDENHAEFIRAANPRPEPKPRYEFETFPDVRNPGLPRDLFTLAVRYCAEVHGDGVEATQDMLSDLLDSQGDWFWWIGHFREKLGIPDLVRCVDCFHTRPTTGGLGICSKGVEATGACGQWWQTDGHYRVQFTAGHSIKPI